MTTTSSTSAPKLTSSTFLAAAAQPPKTAVNPSPNAEKVGFTFLDIIATPYNYFFPATLAKGPETTPTSKVLENLQTSNMVLFKELKTVITNANLELTQINEWVNSISALSSKKVPLEQVGEVLKRATVFLLLLNSSVPSAVKNDDFVKNMNTLNQMMNKSFVDLLKNAKIPALQICLFINQIEKALVDTQLTLSQALGSYRSENSSGVSEDGLKSLQEEWLEELFQAEQKAEAEAKAAAEQPQPSILSSIFLNRNALVAASTTLAPAATTSAPTTRMERIKANLPNLHFVKTLPHSKLFMGIVTLTVAVASAIWYQQTHSKSTNGWNFKIPFLK